MIIYKGISITDVAPVDIADIVVSGVKRNVTARDRMTHAGAEFVRVVDQTRQVTITLADRTNDAETRLSEIDAINAWAAGDQPEKLVLPYRDGKYLMALCTSFVEPSYRQWWENKLKLVFTAYEPYFYAPAENSAPVSTTGRAFSITGTAEPLMRIETVLTQERSSLSWTFDDTVTLALSGTIPAGTVTVDLNHQTIRHSTGTNLNTMLTLASRFPEIKRKMAVTASRSGTLYWRERYV